MKCIECDACRKGFWKSKPEAHICIGVKEPFEIVDIYRECTEYPEKRGQRTEAELGKWDEDSVPFCNVCRECGAIVERGCVKRNGGLHYCPNCGTKND